MFSPDRTTARATTLIVISAASFGSLTTLVLFTTRAGLPLIATMFWRYLFGGMLLFVLISRAPRVEISRRQAGLLIAVGGVGQAVITYLSLLALNYLPVGPLAFLFYTYPVWVAIISAARGTERLTYARISALIIAMAGIAIMVGAPAVGSLNPIGVMLALGAAVLYALYLPALDSAQKGIPSLTATFYLVVGVTMSFFIASVTMGELRIPSTITLWGYVALLSLVCTVVAFGTLLAGLKTLGPVRTAIIATVEPFFTAVLGALFLREIITAEVLIGGGMIAVAVMLLQWQGARTTIAPDPARGS